MFDWLADLGMSIARWPGRMQSVLFYGYCVTFGISGVVGEWLRRRAASRRPLPRGITRVWLPAYMVLLVLITSGLLVITTATQSARSEGDQAKLPAGASSFIDRMHYASSIGLLVIIYIGVALWLWVRKCKTSTKEQERT